MKLWLGILLFVTSVQASEAVGRLEFAAQLGLDTESAASSGARFVDISYAYRLQRTWIVLFAGKATGGRADLADSTGSAVIDSSATSATALGLGLGYQSHFFRSLFQADEVFETTMAGLARYSASSDQDYAGFGLRADFGIYHRLSSSAHYGPKLAYRLAPLENAQTGDALTLSRLSVGLAIGFLF